MIRLQAVVRAKPGKEPELEKQLKSVFPLVEQEKGIISYILHRSTANPGVFMFMEKYLDQAALDFHMNAPYVRELFAKFPELVDGEPQIEFYDEIAAIKTKNR